MSFVALPIFFVAFGLLLMTLTSSGTQPAMIYDILLSRCEREPLAKYLCREGVANDAQFVGFMLSTLLFGIAGAIQYLHMQKKR